MTESKNPGFIRQKMSLKTAPPGDPSAMRQQAIEARRAFYSATRELDGLIRRPGTPEALKTALRPFLEAAAILPVSPNDTK